jgi:pyruvate formate lyase activating enzyme
MIAAGLQKLSLVDYPGHLSAVVFLQGCNFRCGYCQNPDLIKAQKTFDLNEEDIFSFLEKRRDKLEAVVISGGEPAIHEDLPGFIRELSGYGLKVKLDTNGSVPSMIKKLLQEGLLDYIALDIKTSLSKYHLLTDQRDIDKALAESIRLCMSSGIPYEFRTTCVPGIVDEEDLISIGELVKGAERYFLQQFRPDLTYSASFREVRPFDAVSLERFAAILRPYVKHVEIRGI